MRRDQRQFVRPSDLLSVCKSREPGDQPLLGSAATANAFVRTVAGALGAVQPHTYTHYRGCKHSGGADMTVSCQMGGR